MNLFALPKGPMEGLPNNHNLMRRIAVTPVGFYFLPPSVEQSNRVIREFKDHLFIRITFADENLSPIINTRDLSSEIWDRIENVLSNGITAANKKFSFLHFSSSQLRECGAWFLHEEKDVSVEKILKWMGFFSILIH